MIGESLNKLELNKLDKIDELIRLMIRMDNSEFNFDQIKNLYFFKSKRWDIETKAGLIVKLPLDQIEVSLNYLSKIILLK